MTEEVLVDGRLWIRIDAEAVRELDLRAERWILKESGLYPLNSHRICSMTKGRWVACPPGIKFIELKDRGKLEDHIFEAEDWKDIASLALAFLYLTYGKEEKK